jgi:orotate phosphoribosyltransferase
VALASLVAEHTNNQSAAGAAGAVECMCSLLSSEYVQKAFAAANVPFVCLTNYPSLITLAVEKGYLTKEQESILLDWRNSPSTWTGK